MKVTQGILAPRIGHSGSDLWSSLTWLAMPAYLTKSGTAKWAVPLILEGTQKAFYRSVVTHPLSYIIPLRRSATLPGHARRVARHAGRTPANNVIIARQPGTRRIRPDTRPGLAPWLSVCLKCSRNGAAGNNAQGARKSCLRNFTGKGTPAAGYAKGKKYSARRRRFTDVGVTRVT